MKEKPTRMKPQRMKQTGLMTSFLKVSKHHVGGLLLKTQLSLSFSTHKSQEKKTDPRKALFKIQSKRPAWGRGGTLGRC